MRKGQKEYVLEDLLVETRELLEGVGEADNFIKDLSTQSAESVDTEMRKKAFDSITETIDLQTRGYCEITVSGDDMRAVADFFPPSAEAEPLTTDEVAELIDEREIAHGVDWEGIREAVFRCNTELKPVTDVVIARGEEPIDEVPEHLEIEQNLEHPRAERIQSASRIDFKTISPFVLVKKGEVLARIVGKKPGSMGITVKGKSLPYGRARVVSLKPGKNTHETENAVVSSCDGRFEADDRGFSVHEVLEISDDVDYRTGNIDFPGDVIIRGEISDGFTVRAGGSVYCARTMDASEVVCGKDVIVQQGIIGKREGVLKAEGRIEAKFIENCYVQAGGPITVEVGVMNSSVHTQDRLELGYKGVIIGGKTYAQNGIDATQLGSQSGTKTEIYCGIDYSVEQKLDWIRDKNIELAMKLNRVKEEIRRSGGETKGIVELRDKLQAAIHRMNEAAVALVHHLDRNEEVEITVRGNAFPGVYIEICRSSYIVHRRLSGVRFRLDKTKGTVVVENVHTATRR